MTAAADLQFLRDFQRLLDEGAFVSTYKFALLQALADLAVERDIEADGRLHLPVKDIAGKFIEYYWRQVLPYQQGGVLHQNTGRQAEVIHHVQEARAHYHGKLGSAVSDTTRWMALQNEIARIIREMPLWRLQTVGNQSVEFLYRRQDFRNDQIVLLPGVARAFRTFHGLVTHLIRGGWVTQIQRIGANRAILGEAEDLPTFLFGVERQTLARFREVLHDHQQGRCFYCERLVARNGELDHFVPWARYPLDVGQNFVFAHRACNNAKRDHLAAIVHLARWRETNLRSASLVADLMATGLASDPARTLVVTRWAYEHGSASRAQLWISKNEFEATDARWREILGVDTHSRPDQTGW